MSDSRNERQKGLQWSEWELVKRATPRFLGHKQPVVPLWGYTDEADPEQMAQKIDAAADHGIDAFIFDWYYYDDGPFLEKALEQGFLKAPNHQRLKFAVMWANHDWEDIHPYVRGAERRVLYPGSVAPETFDSICDHAIENYFKHPSYWLIQGKPYFSIYDLSEFVESFGSVAEARRALSRFREKAEKAGFPGVHVNAVAWGIPVLPSEEKIENIGELVGSLGFDSVTSYVWVHHVALPKQETDYAHVRDKYFEYWDQAEGMFGVPYFPNVTVGWDPSPRASQSDEYGDFGYPFTNTITNNTPEQFEETLRAVKRRLLESPSEARVLNLNSWNEWTEGSYLEPDTTHQLRYLEAIPKVFGSN